MTPNYPPLNPSQAVERIREIIVGRHLDRLEQRVARLESGPYSGPAPVQAFATTQFEDRLIASEARLEALKDNVQRFLVSSCEQNEIRLAQQREETQRLAAQIQQIAASKANEPPAPIIQQLEQEIGGWLSSWQSSLRLQLDDRDQRITHQIRDEVATLWESTESQLTRLESRAADRDSIEERFSRIALAARALAECASPSPVQSGPPQP